MKNFLTSFVNTNGVAFPNTAAVNSSGGGSTDGTEFIKAMVDDLWGFQQGLLNYTGDTPNGNSEVGASQQLASIQKHRVFITIKTDNSTHTVETWNKKSVLILDTGCTTGRISGGTGANRSNKCIVYNKVAGTCNIDFGATAAQEVITLQKDQWIEFCYDDTLAKFVFQRSNKELIITVTSNLTIGDWIPNGTTFICNPNTATQYGLLTITLPTLADNIGKKFNFIYGNAGGTYGGLVKIICEGSENLLIDDNLTGFMYLFMKGNRINILNDGVAWDIIDRKIKIISNLLSRSDWTNVAFGFCKINYKTKSSTSNALIGSTVVETGGNVNKGVVIFDSAPAGNSGYIIIYNCASTTTANNGVFANNNTMTFSNGITANVDEGAGTNKNINSVIYHGLGLPSNVFKKAVFVFSATFSYNGSYIADIFATNTSNDFGYSQIDENSSYYYTGAAGVRYLTVVGGAAPLLDSQDWFYGLILDI
jgi:hypothetical protein